MRNSMAQFRLPSQYEVGAIYDESDDNFRMFSFKIKRCPRLRSHDWTQCPFAHRGERAARRDPQRFGYCALPCPDFRDFGMCFRGEMCLFAHGVFEQWLHPHRYRTRLCSAGLHCQRQVCFFAHTVHELRAEEPPPMFYVHQPWPEVQEVATSSSQEVATSSSQAGPPDFPTNILNAFTGGNDFLSSFSGVRMKENETITRSGFEVYANEQNVPNISWVEEMMVE